MKVANYWKCVLCTSKRNDAINEYPRGVYVNSQSVFDELREEDIDIPRENDYFPHWVTYDFGVFYTEDIGAIGW